MNFQEKLEDKKAELAYRKVKYHVTNKRTQKRRGIKQWIFEKIINTKFGYLVVGLIIGGTFIGCYLERGILFENTTVKIDMARASETSKPGLTKELEKVVIMSEDEHINELVDEIYRKESSRGKNDDKCHRLGAHNGFGFGQGEGKNFCLASDLEMRQNVFKWVQERIGEGLRDNELLCYYNTGQKTTESEKCKTYLAI